MVQFSGALRDELESMRGKCHLRAPQSRGSRPLWAGHLASRAPASFSLIGTGAVITSPPPTCVSEDWGKLAWSAGLRDCGPEPMAGPPSLFPL